MTDRETAKGGLGKKAGSGARILLIGAAVLCVVLVFLIGFYQFRSRAEGPIDEVRKRPIPGTDETIGEGILDYLLDRGIPVVSEGFKPTWGAEEVGDGEWVVSYVFEVGRQSRWVSWEVRPDRGEVVPRDDLARDLMR